MHLSPQHSKWREFQFRCGAIESGQFLSVLQRGSSFIHFEYITKFFLHFTYFCISQP